ncbi:MAG: glutamate racemase [Candidatus Marinimicrobia bacterium]|nr:glutamate racemase [Candidatus Neomarinimicrobiota bacterium]MCK9560413.1 glutamate racemase [Candidatus Neomarinimicrobiota bacterium]MDD5061865.1 glutamate racemase [Candidatus Neomarinimicrobiota bacterium]
MTNQWLKINSKRNLPIGVFDSGLGGLTVVKQLIRQLPREQIIYFGDTARVPYGNKSAETVQKFSLQIANFLAARGVKMIVVACNTASSFALEMLQTRFDLPVIGVIEPGVRSALVASPGKKIGVIGTTGTINSGKYIHLLLAADSSAEVFTQACPLFVPLVEEGWEASPITEMVAREYLQKLSPQIDTLILGCTHYPIIKNVIQKVVDGNIRIIDTAVETANQVRQILTQYALLSDLQKPPKHQYYVSDLPQKFEEIAERFLGEPIVNVERVHSEDLF